MWEKIVEYGKQLFSLTATQQKHSEEIKELRDEVHGLHQEMNDMKRLMELVLMELQRDREMAQRDRENLLLRLELALVKSGKELPPGSGLNVSGG